MGIKKEDIEFNDKDQVICKGVNLCITRQTLQDYQFQTGFDAREWIEMLYYNSLVVIRDDKIKLILDEEEPNRTNREEI